MRTATATDRKSGTGRFPQDERAAAEDYIGAVRSGDNVLEQQAKRIDPFRIREKLGLLPNQKLLVVPFQQPRDTVIEFFSGPIKSFANFYDLVAGLPDQLGKDWLVVYKKHPVEDDLEPIPGAVDVSEFNIYDLLEVSDAVLVINSGTGLLGMMFGKPVYILGRCWYAGHDMNVPFSVSDDVDAVSVSQRIRTGFQMDYERVLRFVHYLRFQFYSFGVQQQRRVRYEDGSPITATVGIDFYEVRGFTANPVKYRRCFSPIAKESPIFDRYDIDSLECAPATPAVTSSPASGHQRKGGRTGRELRIAKWKKLRRDPKAFLADSDNPILRAAPPGIHVAPDCLRKPFASSDVKSFRDAGMTMALTQSHSSFLLDQQIADLAGCRLGWGRKPSGERARRMRCSDRLAFPVLEDGFLRSVEREGAPLSLVVDDLGIYYDCRHPSRLEELILEPLDQGETCRAQALIRAWRQARASKYNHARDYAGVLPERYVLVCDQTFGDMSVQHGGADAASFRRMLEAALSENPDCSVVVKTHPDVVMGRKRGYLDWDIGRIDPRIHLIAEDCHAASLLEKADAVYTVTSQMGFEALLWGRKVRCFGMPFYAGWGLTLDDREAPSRRRPVGLEQLVHAALVRYPRYVDPETGERCEVERALAHVELQRRMRGRFPPRVHAVGFSRWKRPIVKRFLAGSEVVFARTARQVPEGAAVALWGRADPRSLPRAARPVCLEEGSCAPWASGRSSHSRCPGCAMTRGFTMMPPSRRGLSGSLRMKSSARRCSSARSGFALWFSRAGLPNIISMRLPGPRLGGGRKSASHVILVAGQVEDDASLRHGAPGIKHNGELLRAVRKMNPRSYIVYKPHPDVVAGLRRWGREETNASIWCDEIVLHEPISRMFEQADEVHTLTSLAGFEALLRGKPVTCHGLPFYAGWGLTTDMVSTPRRNRRLTLDELVAGALILYPSYVSRVTGQFTTPERAVAELIAWRAEGGSPSAVRRLLRPVLSFGKRFHRLLQRHAGTSGRLHPWRMM